MEHKMIPLTREKAIWLLRSYEQRESDQIHYLETEAIMGAVAEKLGEDVDYWGMLGLLHDVDWAITRDKCEDHCIKAEEILKKQGFDKEFIETIFYSVETNKSRNKSYLDITISTIASAIDLSKYQSTKAVILIDGLQKSQVRLVSTRLRRVGLSIEKVRGVKKDENNIFIRLADSFAGFIRENVQNYQHKELLKKLTEKRIITNIEQSKNPRT